MKNVTIHRCPTCQNIGSHADQLQSSLRDDANLNVKIVDGKKGEFSVDVDGRKINTMDGESLRIPDEVAAEIRGAKPAAAH